MPGGVGRGRTRVIVYPAPNSNVDAGTVMFGSIETVSVVNSMLSFGDTTCSRSTMPRHT